MRNLTAGNKMNFTIFAFIILIILIMIVCSVTIVLNNGKEEYEVSSTSCLYDNNYNYIKLENDGVVTKKWTGEYYLKENDTKKEYELGKYAISFDKNRKTVDLFGTFYQVLKGGDISKLSEYNTVNGAAESKFYKIDDRKYLIVAKNIENDTGSLSTQNYLIIIVDKLGNALLLNNEIDAKTIKEMIIKTDNFAFDVANEVLTFDEEKIDLKKIIGSTNEYVQVAQKDEDEEENSNIVTGENANVGQSGGTTTTTTENNSSTTIIQDGGNGSQKQDTSWVDSFNNWVKDVAAGFESIYKGNSNKKEESSLNRSVTLNSLNAGTTYIDINYTITDPENKFNVVYANVSNGVDSYNISLDKSGNTYRLEGLKPNTNYLIEIGYKILYADSTTDEKVEDTMTTRTKNTVESLEITRVSTSKVYYRLQLDSNFVYDSNAKLVVYLNDQTEYLTINLTADDLEKAASSGYLGSFSIPNEYKTKNSSIKIKLENTSYNGTAVDTNLTAKIVNY